VGAGLLLVDVAYPSSRRLVETFTLKSLASNPFGIEAMQGTSGHTLQEAMLMCGSGLFAELRDIYMVLFRVPVGSVDVLNASQLVSNTGISGATPATLKELVGAGIDITSNEDTVTLTADNTELSTDIAALRSDVDANTLELSNIDLSPYQLALTAGTGDKPLFPILADTTIRALQGDGDITMEVAGGLIRISAATLRQDVDEEAALRETLANRVTTTEGNLSNDIAALSSLTTRVVVVENRAISTANLANFNNDLLATFQDVFAAKQGVLGVGEPDEPHHKLFEGNIVLSLTAKNGATIEQRSNTHLEISSSGVDWTSGPASSGGYHYIDVGELGLTLRNSAGLINTEFLNNGTALFYTDAEVRGALVVRGEKTAPTLNTTLIRASDSKWLILTSNNGTRRMKANNGDVVVPNELEVDSVKANHVNVNGDDIIDLLQQREPKFTAGAPFLKTLTGSGEVVFSIDESKSVVANAFQTSKFMLHSDSPNTMRFQRFDDDGTILSGAWQTAAQLKWSDTLGGAFHVDWMRAKTEAEITIQDGLRIDGPLHVTGSISYGTLQSPFHAARKVNRTNLDVTAKKGGFSVQRESPYSAGVWCVTFDSAHPGGSVISLVVQFDKCRIKVWEDQNNLPTSTSFCIVTTNISSGGLINVVWFFSVIG